MCFELFRLDLGGLEYVVVGLEHFTSCTKATPVTRTKQNGKKKCNSICVYVFVCVSVYVFCMWGKVVWVKGGKLIRIEKEDATNMYI